MPTHPLPHIHQGQTSQRGREEAKSSEEVSSTLKADVVTSPQRCHQPHAESECPQRTRCSAARSQGPMEEGHSTTLHRIRGGYREKTSASVSLLIHAVRAEFTHQPDLQRWHLKRGGGKERIMLPTGVLSCAERGDPSQHHSWRRRPLDWMDRCTAPAPQLPWKWRREAERSSYHGILNSSPPSLTLMILESDVYMLTLKV